MHSSQSEELEAEQGRQHVHIAHVYICVKQIPYRRPVPWDGSFNSAQPCRGTPMSNPTNRKVVSPLAVQIGIRHHPQLPLIPDVTREQWTVACASSLSEKECRGEELYRQLECEDLILVLDFR